MADLDFGAAMDKFVAKSDTKLDNSFGSAMDSYIGGNRRQQFLGTVNASVDTNPDEFAKDRNRAQFLNVPTAAVQALPADTERQAKVKEIEANTENAPALRNKFSDADFAKLAHDDTQNLSSMETVLNFLGDAAKYIVSAPGQNTGLVRDIGAAGLQTLRQVSALNRAVAAPLADYEESLNGLLGIQGKGPLRAWEEAAGRSAEYLGKQAKEVGSQWSPDSLPARIFGGGVSAGVTSATQNISTAVLASWALGPEVGIPVTLGMMALGQGAESFQSAKEKGVGTYKSLLLGAEDATAEYVTEKYLGLAGFMEKALAGAGAKKLLMYEVSKELPGEMAATLWQNFNQWLTINPDKPIRDFISEQPEALAQTVVATLVGGGGQIGVTKALEGTLQQYAQEQAKIRSAQDQRAMMEYLSELAQSSKLKARSPEVFEQFIQSATDGTPAEELYINANVLMQSGVGEQVAQALPAVAEQLPAALQSDGFVRIPTAQYASTIAGTEIEQHLIDNLKLDPNGYTFAESQVYAKSFNQEIQTQLEKKMLEHEGDQNFKASRDVVRDQFLGQLNQTKRFTEDVNNAYATMLANFYSVTAAKLGMSPQELVDRYQLGIRGNQQQNAQYDQNGKLITESGFSQTADINTLLRDHGQQVTSNQDALRAMSNGDRVFGFHEMGDEENGQPLELTTAAQVESFAPDQILVLPKNAGTLNQAAVAEETNQDNANSLSAERISPRMPTAVKSTENANGETRLQPDLDTAKLDPAAFAKNIGLMQQYINFQDLVGTPDEVAEKMIERMVENLLWLHDHWSPENRVRSKMWYIGGNRISHRWSNRFGITPQQVAAVIAATSPQKDWFQNVSLAERILDAVINNSDVKWTPQMSKLVKSRDWGGKASKDLGYTPKKQLKRLEGKTLRDLYNAENPSESLLDMAVWIRAWDEAHNPQMARVITPEGGFANKFDSTKGGKPIALRWQSFATIAKTLEILQAQTPEEISNVIGANHKVRSFFNNIIAPQFGEDVTIDTHAVAAALMRPLSSSDLEVFHNFGSGKPPKKDKDGNIIVAGQPGTANSAITGLYGTYAIYAEAYRRAAEKRGVLPRQMQSITWEAVRGLFKPEQKRSEALKAQIQQIWDNVAKGETDVASAREEISKLVGGIENPAWIGSAPGADETATDSSYARELPGTGLPGRSAGSMASGTGGNATPGNQGSAGVLNQSQPTFYSALAQAVEQAKQTKAPASDWLSIITKLPGVKAEEIEWTGLKDYLTLLGKEQVTKEQITSYLASNGVQIKEVMKGEINLLQARQIAADDMREVMEAGGTFDDDAESALNTWLTAEPGSRSEIQSEALLEEKMSDAGEGRTVFEFLDAGDAQSDNTRYGDYTLPGGENYREMLLTLPVQMSEKDTQRMMKLEADRRRYKYPYIFDDTEDGKELQELQEKAKAQVYRSSHWAEQNILAHIRFNDRVDADGKRVLFIEELQSDWAQEGRKKGFAGGVDKAEAALKKFTDDLVAKYGIDGLAEGKDTAEEKAEFARLTNAVSVAKRGVPTAPFVGDTKGWLNLSLKRMIRYAAENGYDRVAFVNGKQSAERYALSQAVKDISWTDRQDGGRMVMMALTNGTPVQLIVEKDGNVSKAKNLSQAQGKPLDEIVGKDLATKIMAEKGGDLEGVQMDVGGEGMKSFYDKIVPNAVSSLIKKMDGNVEPIEFRNQEGRFTVIDSKSGQQVGRFQTVEEANSFMAQAKSAQSRGTQMWFDANDLQHALDNSKTEQLGFTITDKMREVVMAGQPLFQPGGQAPRGQIFFGNDITQTQSILSLLEKADLSTFIHESGHFFLQVQADLAARIQAQISAGASVTDGERSIVDDMNKTLEWFGIKGDDNVTALDRWSQMTLEEQRPYHEKFARGFEAYAFEGKAPTMELQTIFQKFASWLKHIYTALKNLNVDLTDEVRSVMDRMLATNEQIEAAEAARNMGPLFTPENANGIISDWAAYHNLANEATQTAIDELQAKSLKNVQWESRARSKFLKDLQKRHDELRGEMRREVTREVMSQPIYQLWQFLTTRAGEEVIPGETQVTPENVVTLRGKLRTEPLKEMYGNEADASWRTLSRLRMTSDKTGMHPEIVAELFGYDSADAMVQALIKATPPSQVIDAITDQRMLERHGELVDPKAIAEAADQAVHNELRAKMLHAEATALERAMQVRADAGTTKQGRRKTYAVLPKAAQEFAQRLVNALKVRDIRPAQYAAAEARAAKAAEGEFKAGNLEGAAEQKRIQIINNYATRAAYQAQNDVRSAVAYLRRFDKKSKTLDVDYYDQIAQILERFDLVPSTSLKTIDKRTSLAGWLQAQEEQGIVPDIPPEIAAEAFRKSYKDMTVEELMGLRDTIRQLEHLGRLKHKLLTAKDNREFAAIRDEMAESIIANGRGRQANNRTPNTILGEKLVALKNFWASHIKAATWARIMDGGKDGGPVWEYLIRTANDAGNREVVAREKATRELSELLAPVLAQGKMGGKGEWFSSIGRSLNKEARLAMALNIGNASNMQRLLGGEGWTLEQIKPVMDTLTTADWNFVQAVWDYFESYRPQIAEKERRVYGKEPNWIDPQPLTVQTRDGDTITLRGGYYPVKYDPRASERAESHMEAEDAKRMMQGAYTSATTRRSFTKERVDAVEGRPLLYSLDGIYNGINEVIHDLSWHEWLIDANRIIKNPKISEAMRETYGAEVHQQFKNWIKDVAEGDRGAQHAGEKALAWIRQGTSVAGLGINVMSALLQPFGITQSMVRIGSKYVGKGVAKTISDPVGTNAEICEMSDFMRTRSLTRMRELAELRNQVKGQTKLRANVDAAAYALMLRAQQLVDIPTWWGAYEKATAEGNAQDRAVALADQAVIDAQGSGTTKDLAAIERGGPALKLFTTFYSFMNTSLNLGVSQTMTSESKAKLASDYLLIYVVPVVLISLMKSAFTPGDSGDWDDPKKIALKLLKEEISFLMGLFFGVREISGIADAFQGKPTGDYAGPAGLRLIPDTMKLAKQVGQGEMDDGLRKSVINVTGELLRLPAAQINRTITGAEALGHGDTKNPAALVFGYEKPH